MRECLRRKSAARTAAMNGARESPSPRRRRPRSPSPRRRPQELPHDGRMCVVDGANHAGQAAVLVGAPAGEEMRREERLDPAVEGRRLAFRRSRAAGAMERLTDPGRERVAPRLPRSHIVSGRGNHRQRVARGAAAVVERGNRFPLPAAIAVGIGEHARPQERRKDRGRIEPLGRSIQGQRCRRFHDRDLPAVFQQCGCGGAEVRQGDEHAAPVEQRDPGEIAARDRKHVLARLPVDAAALPVGFEKHARVAVLCSKDLGPAVRAFAFFESAIGGPGRPEPAPVQHVNQRRLGWDWPTGSAARAGVCAPVAGMDAETVGGHRISIL